MLLLTDQGWANDDAPRAAGEVLRRLLVRSDWILMRARPFARWTAAGDSMRPSPTRATHPKVFHSRDSGILEVLAFAGRVLQDAVTAISFLDPFEA